MNIFPIANSIAGLVNAPTAAQLFSNTGYLTDAAGNMVPQYAAPVAASVQVQALSGPEIMHINNLDIQGVVRGVYLLGNWHGIVRADKVGGDLLQFAEKVGGPQRKWLVAAVLESWPTWTKVAAWLQVDQ